MCCALGAKRCALCVVRCVMIVVRLVCLCRLDCVFYLCCAFCFVIRVLCCAL